MLFPDRTPCVETVPITERPLYERYLAERRAYKEELCDEVAGHVAAGCVLEVASGWGYTGLDLLHRNPALSVVSICESVEVLRRATERACDEGLAARWHGILGRNTAMPFEAESFDGVVSTNSLHIWKRPVAVLREMHRVIRGAGTVYVNDLRRDAEEPIAEYIVRSLHEDQTPFGEFSLRTFVTSWRAAYTVVELESLLEAAGIGSFAVEPEGAVTLTARFRRTSH